MSPKNDAGQEVVNPLETDAGADSASNGNDREVRVSSKTAGQIKCSICQSTFRRPEHLKRHFRSHTKEKPFECLQCGRHFSRTDTLHRHELSHHALGSEGGKDRTHRITVKTFRACLKCAVARVRCSGGAPCARCENRSFECHYPTERRSRVKAQKEASRDLSAAEENTVFGQTSHEIPSPPTDDSHMHPAQAREKSIPRSSGYQITEFQLPLTRLNASNISSKDPTDHDPHRITQDQPRDTQNSRRVSEAGESGPHSFLSDANGLTGASRVPFSSYNGVGSLQPHPQMPTVGVQSTFSANPASRLSYQVMRLQPKIPDSNMNIEITAVETPGISLGFDTPFLDQSMPPTLNWLPNDLFSGSASDQSLSSKFPPHSDQTGVLDDSWTRSAWLSPVINSEHINSSLRENISQNPPGNTPLGTEAESPAQFSGTIGEESLLPQPSTTTKHSADYNADGARLAKYRRKQGSWSRSPGESLDILCPLDENETPPRFSFPTLQKTIGENISEEEATFNFQIEAPTYDSIYRSFNQLCCKENFLYARFESEQFPNAEILSSFIRFYFNSFQPVYPMLHIPTFNPNTCHWLLTLAVSAVGCHFSGLSELNECTAAFHEFLRRAINVEKEKCRLERMPLWLLQAMTLNCIGLLYSSNEQSRVTTLSIFGDLVNFTTRERLLYPSGKSRLISSENSQERKWIAWIEDEVRRRTGYLIWLVDCTLAYHFDNRPLLSLDDGQAPLPSHESLWQAKSAGAWSELSKDSSSGPRDVSLYKAVLIMYIEKTLVPNIGEFSHILLIHALYHRMWEVGDYFRRPLSFWRPTAKKQSCDSAIPSGSVWLPGIPSYSKWRNSACDCLDILHWTACSTIAKAAGFEHPTVLHLHAARLVLLVPFREIQSLATLLAMGKVAWSDYEQAIEWHYILRWIKHDQYKARLSIIHAGAILWHARRYSTNAFHEPMAVFLAILSLWAYGLSHSQMFQDHSSRFGPRRDSSSDPRLIHLDLPCEEEIQQLFIREGQTMRGNVTGVGDICGPHGPERILRVGCEILGSLTSWGLSKRFIALLTRLAELSTQP